MSTLANVVSFPRGLPVCHCDCCGKRMAKNDQGGSPSFCKHECATTYRNDKEQRDEAVA
jgi:hypothetical protein